ncbi:MAG: (2Fe-2S)-binding protein [Acidimicrobiia bacterium]|nr:(2Fe-2S)-binding protein [Acidimicrobiia bacterium]
MTTTKHHIALTVNGRAVRSDVEPRLSLADYLRKHLTLVGTHLGCEQGACGACTVLVDGQSARACLMLAVQADGTDVETVEGLAGTELHPVQEAFRQKQGLQCGFCTPGMLMRTVELIRDNPDINEDEAREGVASNLCRCTGYQYIVEAVVDAAATMRSTP